MKITPELFGELTPGFVFPAALSAAVVAIWDLPQLLGFVVVFTGAAVICSIAKMLDYYHKVQMKAITGMMEQETRTRS